MCIQHKQRKIYLDQTKYLQKVLNHFGLQNGKAIPTPLPEGYQASPNTQTTDPMPCSKFQQVIGSLLYIMLGMQLDVAFAVKRLSQFATNGSQEHLDKAFYICCYLAGTADYAMIFDGLGQ